VLIVVAMNSDRDLYAGRESTQVKGGAMKEELAAQKREKNAVVKLVPADLLARRRDEIDRMIAQRAYELFEGRGCTHGNDVPDWLKAEDEIVHSCRHDLRESKEAITLRAEMPSSYPADQLLISVEPWRLIVSGEREVDVSYWDGARTRTERRPQRIFRAHDLPVEVNPSTSTVTLRDNTLEVIMPKAGATKKPEARSASSGG
jgi:HSP20 family molecular chaperone IbpA